MCVLHIESFYILEQANVSKRKKKKEKEKWAVTKSRARVKRLQSDSIATVVRVVRSNAKHGSVCEYIKGSVRPNAALIIRSATEE